MVDKASQARILAEGTKKEEAADFAAGFGRLAAEMLENARAMPVHPLMAHPAAAFAAATAIGVGLSTQMAGAFFGAFQSALETTGKLAAALDDTPPEEPEPDMDIRPENIRPAAKILNKPAVEKKARPKLTVVAAGPASKPEPVAKAKPAPRTVKADDLKLITGIGPKLEQVLNSRGIRSFAEIAGWSDEDIARLDAELGFSGRIGRDDWSGQAKILATRGRRKK
ncbi:5' DNA nuclease [Rhizobium sp. Pop5]|uniref:5' DNA nuclease n=1 Tax=Rhizobium sp. Pop5 TaxID=1223565 RepID=UPI000283A93A|nr:5' DNA nuclease [Rhizobium sp. Pop5]EJZ23224.1 hypothetical protein RCCGEPOP_00683 [Rhizobium sp. Pop5]UVD58142.1 5' DNA nuclease [Rhizobium sp. Pop5]